MPRKEPHYMIRQQKAAKKPGMFSRVFYIVFALIVVTAFLMVNFCKPRNPKPLPKKESSAISTAPAFRADGRLTLLRQQGEPVSIEIEIADQEDERMQGLMYRHYLPENAGMFFIFDHEELRSFWMKNTYISLDIIYINSDMEIVSIQKYTQPKSTYSLPSEKPAKYVLEVTAGYTDQYDIKPGDRIEYSYSP